MSTCDEVAVCCLKKALADIVVLQSSVMVELVAPHDESLKVLQGKEKQHKDVKSCVGFLQLTVNLLVFISHENIRDNKYRYTQTIFRSMRERG